MPSAFDETFLVEFRCDTVENQPSKVAYLESLVLLVELVMKVGANIGGDRHAE